jgi:hypothetical protein
MARHNSPRVPHGSDHGALRVTHLKGQLVRRLYLDLEGVILVDITAGGVCFRQVGARCLPADLSDLFHIELGPQEFDGENKDKARVWGKPCRELWICRCSCAESA